MALFRLFNTPQHQRFEYKPRYWDPDKEDLKERLERASGEKKDDVEAMKSRISAHFARRNSRSSESSAYRRREIRRSNIRMALILAIIVFIFYLGLVTLPRFLAFFE